MSLSKRQFTINIYGSCVTRDILGYDKMKQCKINTYISRQSIISAVSKSIPCDIQDIKLDSNFKRQAVYHDFIKDTFQRLKDEKSDYLIIDLIDERFNVLQYVKDNITSIVTYSSELQQSQYIKEIRILPKKQLKLFKVMGRNNYIYINGVRLDKYMKEFCCKILEIYSAQQIIVHKARMVDYYIDKQKELCRFSNQYIKNNREVNEVIDYMYAYLLHAFKGCYNIDISHKHYADESHRWGLAPMHYQQSYYEEAMDRIIQISRVKV